MHMLLSKLYRKTQTVKKEHNQNKKIDRVQNNQKSTYLLPSKG